jgi:hypothetical protein
MVSMWPVLFLAAAAQGAAQPIDDAAYRALENEVVRNWRTLSVNRAPMREMSGALRDKVRRLHAASPSFVSLWMYAGTRYRAEQLGIQDHYPDFGSEFAAMTREMTRDYGRNPAPPAFEGLDLTSNDVRGGRSPGKSLFRGAFEIAGWSSGIAQEEAPLRGTTSGDVRHLSHFDGTSLAVLAPVYELAKQLRRNVSVEFSGRALRDLDQDQPLHNVDSALLVAELPAYAITPEGIVAGTFKSAGFFGGACASGQPTAAEFSFGERIGQRTLGVFATGVRIDPARVKVRLDEQTWPDFEEHDGYPTQALATRTIYTVDLDGDGIAELRGVHRHESEIEYEILMRGKPRPRAADEPRFVPVAGWYAYDYNFLDANVGGRWLRLSTYFVVTCT